MAGQFGSESTTDQVLAGVDLSGRRVLITGASAGLGVETARVLAAHGAHVVGAARNLGKAYAATGTVRAQIANGGSFELVELDLASLASVRACSVALLTAGKPFDVVIANAGTVACPEGKTVDGFETQFGTNHLGHFMLVNRIASLMKRGSRLVNLSSRGHRFCDINLDDLSFERTAYTEFGAYGRSKTANILFAVEFDRRHKADGVRATAVHPGRVKTEMSRYMTPQAKAMVEQDTSGTQWKTIAQGAATTSWSGFVAPADLIGGRYCEDCQVAQILDSDDNTAGVRSYAIDPDRARMLWAKSEQLVGERF